MLISPSDVLAPAPLNIDLPSALPLRRLGVAILVCPPFGGGWGVRFLAGVTKPDKGLAGTLDMRLGGRGNELMLTVFLIVLPALLNAGAPLGVGKAAVGAGEGGGPRTLLDGARNPLFGVVGLLFGVAIPPVLFRVLVIGRAGKEELGGPFDGRGRGKVVVMMVDGFFRDRARKWVR